MRRPWAAHHECLTVYEDRLQEAQERFSDVSNVVGEQGKVIEMLKKQLEEKNIRLDDN